jgi:dolichol-phosphate mannosyltransferase
LIKIGYPSLEKPQPLDAMKLSVIVPARDEEENIGRTVQALADRLQRSNIPHEILVVDDGSSDKTATVVSELAANDSRVHLVENWGRHGFGTAVRAGLAKYKGDAVAIVMADGSDDPDDLVKYYQLLLEGYDCVFGSRFMAGSRVIDYPKHKLLVNRVANTFIRLLFGLRFNDITNAFKCYKREVIDVIQPLISTHFNLTVEMPLKAIVRGYSYAITPISWRNRDFGVSKLKIKEMGSRYLFVVLYLWLEKHLSRGDYHRSTAGVLSHRSGAIRS